MGNQGSKQMPTPRSKDPRWQGISNGVTFADDASEDHTERPTLPKYHHNAHSIKKGKKKVQMKSVNANSVARKNKGKSSVKHRNVEKYRGPNKKIRKSLIGNPSNFQHTGHIGAGQIRGLSIDSDKINRQMAEVAAVLKFDETDFGPSWQPTLPETFSIAPVESRSEPTDAARALLHTRSTYHIPAPPPPPPPASMRGDARLRSPKSSLKKPNQSSLKKPNQSSLAKKNRATSPKTRVPVGRRLPAALLQVAAQEKRESEEKNDLEVVVEPEAVGAMGAALTASVAPIQRQKTDEDGWSDVDSEEEAQKRSFEGAFSIPLQATVSTPVQEPELIPVQKQAYVPIPRHEEPLVVPSRRSSKPIPLEDVLVPDVVGVVYKESVKPTPSRSHQTSKSISEDYGLITPPDSLRGNPLEHSPTRYDRQDYPASRQRKTSNTRPSLLDDVSMLGPGSNGYVMSPSRSIPVRDENLNDRYNRQRRHAGSPPVDQDPQQSYYRQRTNPQYPQAASGPEPVRQRRESFAPPPSWNSKNNERARDDRRRSEGMQSRKTGVEDSRRSSMQQDFTKHQSQSDLNLQMYHQYQQEFQRQRPSSRPVSAPRQQREYDEVNPALAPLVINF